MQKLDDGGPPDDQLNQEIATMFSHADANPTRIKSPRWQPLWIIKLRLWVITRNAQRLPSPWPRTAAIVICAIMAALVVGTVLTEGL